MGTMQGLLRQLELFRKAYPEYEHLSDKDILEVLHDFLDKDPSHVDVPSMEEFLSSPFYLGKVDIWPQLRQDLLVLDQNPHLSELICSGSLGWGKSWLGIILILRRINRLMASKNPQEYLGMAGDSELMFVMSNVTLMQARILEINRMRSMIDNSEYFRGYLKRPDVHSEIILDKNIRIVAVGNPEAALGLNVIGALIDESSFRKVVKDSDRTSNPDETTYDVAEQTYQLLDGRIRSRLGHDRKAMGLLVLCSSPAYEGDFTQRRIAEGLKTNDELGKQVMVNLHHRKFDIQPPIDQFGRKRRSGKKMRIFIGTPTKNPRMIPEGEEPLPDEVDRIQEAPIEDVEVFRKDIYRGLRDICGVWPCTRENAFIADVESISKAFTLKVKSVFNVDEIGTSELQKLRILPENFRNPWAMRVIGLDLSQTRCRTGITVAHIEDIIALNINGIITQVPLFVVDGSLGIRPTPQNPINHQDIKRIIAELHKHVPLRLLAADTFDIKGILDWYMEAYGSGLPHWFDCRHSTVGSPPTVYAYLKQAILDGRIKIPVNSLLSNEVRNLVYHPESDQVIKPTGGTKDIADSLAVAIYMLGRARPAYLDWQEHKDSQVAKTKRFKKLPFFPQVQGKKSIGY